MRINNNKSNRASLDLLLQGGLEELGQQVLLPLVGGVVIQREDHRVHELGGFVLRHLKDQLGEIRRVGLRRTRGAGVTGDSKVLGPRDKAECVCVTCNR